MPRPQKEEVKEEVREWTTHTGEVLGDVGQTVRSALEKVPVGKEAEDWGLTLALILHGFVNLMFGLAYLLRPQMLFPMAQYFKVGDISWSFIRKFGWQVMYSSCMQVASRLILPLYRERQVYRVCLLDFLFYYNDCFHLCLCLPRPFSPDSLVCLRVRRSTCTRNGL